MDKISFIAILGGLTAILAGQALEGGNIASLIQVTAFLIVVGGTASAVMLQSTPRQFVTGLQMAKWVFMPPAFEYDKQIKDIVGWSNTARRSGLLALEANLNGQKDLFTRKALQLLVDGAEPQLIREVLEVELETHEQARRLAARIWESAGGYSPTMGILGAVMGLIHVMENLSDPSKLGSGIAVAFVATVYGVGAANLLFLPMANKLKHLITLESTSRELVIEGVVAIANGENPRQIDARLRGYLAIAD